MAASIDSLLAEISETEDPIEELKNLKTAVLSVPPAALRDAGSRRRFDVIFSLLSATDRSVLRSQRLGGSDALTRLYVKLPVRVG